MKKQEKLLPFPFDFNTPSALTLWKKRKNVNDNPRFQEALAELNEQAKRFEELVDSGQMAFPIDHSKTAKRPASKTYQTLVFEGDSWLMTGGKLYKYEEVAPGGLKRHREASTAEYASVLESVLETYSPRSLGFLGNQPLMKRVSPLKVS